MAGMTMQQQAEAPHWSTETLGRTIRVVDPEGSDVVFVGGVDAPGVRPLADLIAAAPTMRAKLTRAAFDLDEIEACLTAVIEHGADPQTLDALGSIRTAVAAIAKGLR